MLRVMEPRKRTSNHRTVPLQGVKSVYSCTPHFSKSRKAATLNVKFPKSTDSSQLPPATNSDRHRLQDALPRPRPAPRPSRRLLRHRRSPQGGQAQQPPRTSQSAGPHAPPPRRKHPLTRFGTRGTQELGPGTGRPKGDKQEKPKRRLRVRREGGSHIPEGGAVSQVTRRPEAAKQSVANHDAREAKEGSASGAAFSYREASGHLPSARVGLELRQLLCLDGPCPLLKDAASSKPLEAGSSPFTPPP